MRIPDLPFGRKRLFLSGTLESSCHEFLTTIAVGSKVARIGMERRCHDRKEVGYPPFALTAVFRLAP
jgi:hypothetical protein